MRRLIFTLLYDRGQFMLSRNFRLQKVGTVDWLFNNYDFASVSHGLDELMVLDVSRGDRDPIRFADAVKHISGKCFIPMTVGGGITSMEIAHKYMHSGAEKLLLNSAFLDNPNLCRSLAANFGCQCIVACIDYRIGGPASRTVYVRNGTEKVADNLSEWVRFVQSNGAGELLFQSIEKDGTGMGLDMKVVDELSFQPELPCILMGGVGKAVHIIDGLRHPTVDAVATANLFNFIGAAFLDVRRAIGESGLEMPQWNVSDYSLLRNRFAAGV